MTEDGALPPSRIDNKLYLKDYINDTLYILEDSKLQPAYIFEFGNYSYPIEHLEDSEGKNIFFSNAFLFITGWGQL